MLSEVTSGCRHGERALLSKHRRDRSVSWIQERAHQGRIFRTVAYAIEEEFRLTLESAKTLEVAAGASDTRNVQAQLRETVILAP